MKPMIFAAMISLSALKGQPFNSGSTGADGDLILNTPGTVIFDPTKLTPPIEAGRTVYHFKKITIGAGVTVRLLSRVLGSAPIVWLAQDVVTISGQIDLSGEDGASPTSPYRTFASGGAGGYPGGTGWRSDTQPALNGFGPGGGAAGLGGIMGNPRLANGGTFTGNPYLVPLIGGSGGGGNGRNFVNDSTPNGAGGGGGGGAILIASNSSIALGGSVNGLAIRASGGRGVVYSGGGSGGAVRLMAPVLSGNGRIDVSGGLYPGNTVSGGTGLARLEAFDQTGFTGTVSGQSISSVPYDTYLTSAISAVRIVSIGGVAVPATTTGSFSLPDVSINSTAAVPIVIECKQVPLNAAISLSLLPETGPAQTITFPALTGTVGSSTSTANFTFPTGLNVGLLRAAFTIN